jgi:hypothetical protein
MTLFALKQEIQEIAELTATAMMKHLDPSFDELKFADACKFAGTRWLKWHIKQGTIKRIRKGTAKNSPCYYSRTEILALKKAEVEMLKEAEKAEIIFNSRVKTHSKTAKPGNEQTRMGQSLETGLGVAAKS